MNILITSFAFIVILSLVLFFIFREPAKETTALPDNPSTMEDTQQQDNTGAIDQTSQADQTPTNEQDNQNQQTSDTNDQIQQADQQDTSSVSNGNSSVSDSSNDTIYTIQAGENLYQISIQYYGTGKYYDALAKYNGLNDANEIKAGMKIKIPNVDVLNYK